jgi:hypothetical protein
VGPEGEKIKGGPRKIMGGPEGKKIEIYMGAFAVKRRNAVRTLYNFTKIYSFF